jgi:HNH endonuclease
MDDELTQLVWQRARHRCEYCQLHQQSSRLVFEIDHIIAKKHGGLTTTANLALTCFYCNRFKGSNIAGRDHRSRKVVPLFHPRRHKWSRHFRWNGPVLVGRTPAGRATIVVLNINHPEAIATRAGLMEAPHFPHP